MKRLLAVFALLAGSAFGQVANPSIIMVNASPSGTCFTNLPWQYNIVNGTGWYCGGTVSGGVGTWQQFGSSGGSSTFSAVSISGLTLDAANYSTLNAAILAANAYATTNESGSGHAVNVQLHDATYSLSPVVASQTVTSVAASSSGTAVYSGTFACSGWTGLHFYVSGFTNNVNNGDYIESACTSTTLTLSNAFAVAETHAATAVSPTFVASGVSILGVPGRMEVIANQPPDEDNLKNGGAWIDCGGYPCFVMSGANGNRIQDIGFTDWAGNFLVAGGNGVNGLLFGEINNVKAIGPSSYTAGVNGILCYNCQHVHSQGVSVFNVTNALTQANQNGWYNSGNSQWDNFYANAYPLSAANGNNGQCAVTIESLSTGSGTQTTLINTVEMNFPQINAFGGDGTAAEVCVSGLSGVAANSIVLNGADVEGNNLDTVSMSNVKYSQINLTEFSSNTHDILLGAGATDNSINCSAACDFDPTTFSQSGNNNFMTGLVRNWYSNIATANWGIGVNGPFIDYGNAAYSYLNTFVNTTSGGTVGAYSFLAPNATSNAFMLLGIDRTNTYNSAEIAFQYAGNGSQGNGVAIGLFNESPELTINGYGQVIPNSINMAGDTSKGISNTGAGTFTSISNTLAQNATAAVVASASTIAPTTPLIEISGTTAINTVTLPSGFSSGCLDVLATGAWSTGTSGNIQNALTAVANTSYRLCYWPTISKWTVK